MGEKKELEDDMDKPVMYSLESLPTRVKRTGICSLFFLRNSCVVPSVVMSFPDTVSVNLAMRVCLGTLVVVVVVVVVVSVCVSVVADVVVIVPVVEVTPLTVVDAVP